MDHLLVSQMVEYPSTESRWIVRTENRGNKRLMGEMESVSFCAAVIFLMDTWGEGMKVLLCVQSERMKREEKKDKDGWGGFALNSIKANEKLIL